MSRYAPTALMLLPLVWAFGVIVGFTRSIGGSGQHSWRDSLLLSGSSVTTLGFRAAEGTWETLGGHRRGAARPRSRGAADLVPAHDLPALLAARDHRGEAVHPRRERQGFRRSGHADHPLAHHRRSRSARRDLGGVGQLVRRDVRIAPSFPALNFFRSPDPDRSWITGAGIVLDLASIYLSAIDVERNPRAALMVRSGFLSLRSLCEFFGIPYDDEPAPDDPISVSRDEYLAVHDKLAAAGRAGARRSRRGRGTTTGLAGQLRRTAHCARRLHHGALSTLGVRPSVRVRPTADAPGPEPHDVSDAREDIQ